MNQQYPPPQNNPQQNPQQPYQPQPVYPQQPVQQPGYPPQGYPQQPVQQPGYPPQQPYGQPPPPYGYQGYPPPQPKKSGSGWLTCLIIAIVLGCIGICITGVFLFAIGKFSIGFLEQYRDELQQIVPGLNIPSTVGEVFSSANSLTLTSSQGGTITLPGGAMLTIPPAAVPRSESGGEGTMVFTMEETTSVTAQMPTGYDTAGPVYQLGPEGFTFTIPLTLTLPIPNGINLDGVLGLSYLDSASNTWKLVPGTVDKENRTVSVAVTHFSPWTIFGTCFNIFGACNAYDTTQRWKEANGGFVEVNNTHLYETGTYPEADGKRLPIGVTYGICINSYTLTNPDVAYAWDQPDDWKMLVSDYYFPGGVKKVHPPMEWWLPAGSYNLIEVMSISEVNHSPGYTPAFTNYWRAAGTYGIEVGKRYTFTVSEVTNMSSWTKGRPPCYGVEDTSVGTGDVQITLTWQTNDDIDLYVTDPDGFVISYMSMYSPSGGALDRDNLCSEMIIGRPENIYWASGQAPSGTYKVQVNYYEPCVSEKSVNWTVRVVRMGITETYTGTLTYDDETQDVTTFTIP